MKLSAKLGEGLMPYDSCLCWVCSSHEGLELLGEWGLLTEQGV